MTPTIIPFAPVAQWCREQGLQAAGVLPLPQPLADAGLDQLLADGVGDMTWLSETRDLRRDASSLLPAARSLLLVTLAYQPEAGCGTLQRARYAAGRDYHALLRRKLVRIGEQLDGWGGPYTHRAAVDSAPINERSLAHRVGLGWIGRNGLIISPRRGSYQVLGCLLTTAAIARHDAGQAADRCGACHRCESACPTAALRDRRVLSERCISYWTIEHRGVVPADLARRFQGYWFGCDICQAVCPWNRFAGPAGDRRLTGHDSDATLLHLDAAAYGRFTRGRALARLEYPRFRRNLLVALASLGRWGECHPLLAEGLPLVMAQAATLGLAAPGGP